MTLTNDARTNCELELNASPEDRISIWSLPKVAWTGVALFSINAIIGIGMLFTPDIRPDMFGQEVRSVYADSLKPSPFAETVDNQKKKVKLATRVRPVLFEPVQSIEQASMFEPAVETLDIPRVSKVLQMDLPLRTQHAVYEMPRKTERAAHSTLDREKKVVVIN